MYDVKIFLTLSWPSGTASSYLDCGERLLQRIEENEMEALAQQEQKKREAIIQSSEVVSVTPKLDPEPIAETQPVEPEPLSQQPPKNRASHSSLLSNELMSLLNEDKLKFAYREGSTRKTRSTPIYISDSSDDDNDNSDAPPENPPSEKRMKVEYDDDSEEGNSTQNRSTPVRRTQSVVSSNPEIPFSKVDTIDQTIQRIKEESSFKDVMCFNKMDVSEIIPQPEERSGYWMANSEAHLQSILKELQADALDGEYWTHQEKEEVDLVFSPNGFTPHPKQSLNNMNINPVHQLSNTIYKQTSVASVSHVIDFKTKDSVERAIQNRVKNVHSFGSVQFEVLITPHTVYEGQSPTQSDHDVMTPLSQQSMFRKAGATVHESILPKTVLGEAHSLPSSSASNKIKESKEASNATVISPSPSKIPQKTAPKAQFAQKMIYQMPTLRFSMEVPYSSISHLDIQLPHHILHKTTSNSELDDIIASELDAIGIIDLNGRTKTHFFEMDPPLSSIQHYPTEIRDEIIRISNCFTFDPSALCFNRILFSLNTKGALRSLLRVCYSVPRLFSLLSTPYGNTYTPLVRPILAHLRTLISSVESSSPQLDEKQQTVLSSMEELEEMITQRKRRRKDPKDKEPKEAFVAGMSSGSFVCACCPFSSDSGIEFSQHLQTPEHRKAREAKKSISCPRIPLVPHHLNSSYNNQLSVPTDMFFHTLPTMRSSTPHVSLIPLVNSFQESRLKESSIVVIPEVQYIVCPCALPSSFNLIPSINSFQGPSMHVTSSIAKTIPVFQNDSFSNVQAPPEHRSFTTIPSKIDRSMSKVHPSFPSSLPKASSSQSPLTNIHIGSWVMTNMVGRDARAMFVFSPKRGLFSYTIPYPKHRHSKFTSIIDVPFESIVHASLQRPPTLNKDDTSEAVLSLILASPPTFRFRLTSGSSVQDLPQPDFTGEDQASISCRHTLFFKKVEDLEDLLRRISRHSGIYSLFIRSNYDKLIQSAHSMFPQAETGSCPFDAINSFSQIQDIWWMMHSKATGIRSDATLRRVLETKQDNKKVLRIYNSIACPAASLTLYEMEYSLDVNNLPREATLDVCLSPLLRGISHRNGDPHYFTLSSPPSVSYFGDVDPTMLQCPRTLYKTKTENPNTIRLHNQIKRAIESGRSLNEDWGLFTKDIERLKANLGLGNDASLLTQTDGKDGTKNASASKLTKAAASLVPQLPFSAQPRIGPSTMDQFHSLCITPPRKDADKVVLTVAPQPSSTHMVVPQIDLMLIQKHIMHPNLARKKIEEEKRKRKEEANGQDEDWIDFGECYEEQDETKPQTTECSLHYKKTVFCQCTATKPSEFEDTEGLPSISCGIFLSSSERSYAKITCPCLLAGEPCSSICECSCCQNPINSVRLSGLFDCVKNNLLSFIFALQNGMLNQVATLPCQGRIHIPNEINLPNFAARLNQLPHTAAIGETCHVDFECACKERVYYSFCTQHLVSRYKTFHCSVCNQCRDATYRHCKRCNRCTREPDLPCEHCTFRNNLLQWETDLLHAYERSSGRTLSPSVIQHSTGLSGHQGQTVRDKLVLTMSTLPSLSRNVQPAPKEPVPTHIDPPPAQPRRMVVLSDRERRQAEQYEVQILQIDLAWAGRQRNLSDQSQPISSFLW
ncbi:hypothetical protein BLNAU_8809 [Blattamonas nauphoetae]|uniref:Uncharacterized protein n=1 Tax=Blattamonas nauphoetae TaxID=2049346 RepID=A0ABQ9XXN6_9EUKA|nr:hypothetical protein BLNAU_8809 [Blattamonas nauphoetae]